MARTTPGIRRAGGAVAATVVTALLAAVARRSWEQVAGAGPSTLDEVVTTVTAALGVLVAVWLGLGFVVAALAHLPGRVGSWADRLAGGVSPEVTRRLAAALVGAVVGTVACPSPAVGAAAPPPGFTVTTGESIERTPAPDLPGPGFGVTVRSTASTPEERTPSPGWTPTRPAKRPQAPTELVSAGRRPAGSVSPAASAGAAEVVVVRGDSLWAIAARHLGPGATDAEVAREWPRWYVANRDTIGADPDLLLPGQVLRVPGSPAVASR